MNSTPCLAGPAAAATAGGLPSVSCRPSALAGIPILALLAFSAAACGGDDGTGGEWQGTVQDSAGVEVVTNTGSGLWAPSEEWTVEQDLRVGQAEGEPEYQFGQIAGVDVDSRGRLYVLDQQAQEVRVFDEGGQFVTRIGKAGSGPGELSQAAGPLFVGPGDTLSVPDVMQQRVTRYGPDGQPVGSYPLPMTGGIPVKWMEAPDQDLIQQAMIMAMPNQPDVEPKNLLLRRDPSGEVEDTVMELPIGRSFDFSGGSPSITIFESEPTWTIAPDGAFYFGNSDQYRLEQYSPQGELVRVVKKPQERQPVTESDQAEYRRIFEDLWKQQGMPPEAANMMREALQFADYYPAYANFLGGPEGTLWVQRVQTPDEAGSEPGAFNIQDTGSATWDVFDPQGRLLGSVTMPPRFTPLVFEGDTLYGIVRDEMDVQYAARMSVRRGERVGDQG